ncbi:tetrahydromethanopterin S-methyltransferase subunit B [Scopulibacillus daqui]|uniref:Tetrahydromethanopterin S-methyltransferase subunit B n=1 Tax=Scopulibacillus daqui TaxID=1469162 RepID=A0ABS2Q3E7_9BACL|nr:YqhR family membrane protein [Scopulibacillus daqui]MBM7646335.1 tetrahydromethanopterin S-methyltransferase subunit B [Scopulibacillus daqui]
MSGSSKPEQNKKAKQATSNGRVALIGFFGGLIWSLIGYLAYLIHFSKVGPSLILAPFVLGKWKNKIGGQFLGILIICIVSILIALLYKYALGKIKSMWVGIIFGLMLWVIVFYVLQPLIPGLDPVSKLGKNTNSISLCLYALYGLFVGYSISFDLESLANEEAGSNQ